MKPMSGQFSKSSIDSLGDRLRDEQINADDIRLLDEYRRSFGRAYEIVVKTLRQQLSLKPTGRPAKSTSSIIEKLLRQNSRLTQIQDIAGCRLVLSDINEQDRIVEALKALFKGARVVDRRIKPSHGYRAVHFIPNVEGKPIEIQIRTSLQHLWAELSEKLADVVDPAIKYGAGNEKVNKLLAHISDTISRIEKLEQSGSIHSESSADELASIKREQVAFLEQAIRDFSE